MRVSMMRHSSPTSTQEEYTDLIPWGLEKDVSWSQVGFLLLFQSFLHPLSPSLFLPHSHYISLSIFLNFSLSLSLSLSLLLSLLLSLPLYTPLLALCPTVSLSHLRKTIKHVFLSHFQLTFAPQFVSLSFFSSRYASSLRCLDGWSLCPAGTHPRFGGWGSGQRHGLARLAVHETILFGITQKISSYAFRWFGW